MGGFIGFLHLAVRVFVIDCAGILAHLNSKIRRQPCFYRPGLKINQPSAAER
jgi:hypothetical protein